MSLNTEKIKAILFDIDGTLSDSDDRVVQKIVKRISPFYRSEKRKQAVARWIVMALESPGNYLYNIADRFDLDSFFIRQTQKYSKAKKHKVQEYWIIPGVLEMMQALSKYSLGIVSARDSNTSLAFLRQFAIEKYFDVVVTSQTCRYTKPFPGPLLHAAEELKTDPANCLMVGDTTVDMRAAKLAGMQAAGVLCGFGREKELKRAGADVILSSTADLQKLMLS